MKNQIFNLNKLYNNLNTYIFNFSQVKIGALVTIEYLLSKTKRRKQNFTGICIAKIKSNSIVVRNVRSGIAVEETFKLLSPLLLGVSIIKKPRKLFKSAKLYYLRNKPLKKSTFRRNTFEKV